jgi:hypothetical protein
MGLFMFFGVFLTMGVLFVLFAARNVLGVATTVVHHVFNP